MDPDEGVLQVGGGRFAASPWRLDIGSRKNHYAVSMTRYQ